MIKKVKDYKNIKDYPLVGKILKLEQQLKEAKGIINGLVYMIKNYSYNWEKNKMYIKAKKFLEEG